MLVLKERSCAHSRELFAQIHGEFECVSSLLKFMEVLKEYKYLHVLFLYYMEVGECVGGPQIGKNWKN